MKNYTNSELALLCECMFITLEAVSILLCEAISVMTQAKQSRKINWHMKVQQTY